MWPFKTSKQSTKTVIQKLPFKSGAAFFEYQCKFGETTIKQNMGIVSIVIDAPKEFGVLSSVKINPDGSQLALINVASEDGGFIVPANTPSKTGDRLVAGDLVIWVPMVFNNEIGIKMGDSRSGWVGMIRAKIAPELDMSKPGFVIICPYD